MISYALYYDANKYLNSVMNATAKTVGTEQYDEMDVDPRGYAVYGPGPKPEPEPEPAPYGPGNAVTNIPVTTISPEPIILPTPNPTLITLPVDPTQQDIQPSPLLPQTMPPKAPSSPSRVLKVTEPAHEGVTKEMPSIDSTIADMQSFAGNNLYGNYAGGPALQPAVSEAIRAGQQPAELPFSQRNPAEFAKLKEKLLDGMNGNNLAPGARIFKYDEKDPMNANALEFVDIESNDKRSSAEIEEQENKDIEEYINANYVALLDHMPWEKPSASYVPPSPQPPVDSDVYKPRGHQSAKSSNMPTPDMPDPDIPDIGRPLPKDPDVPDSPGDSGEIVEIPVPAVYGPGPEPAPVYGPGPEPAPVYGPGPEPAPVYGPGPEPAAGNDDKNVRMAGLDAYLDSNSTDSGPQFE